MELPENNKIIHAKQQTKDMRWVDIYYDQNDGHVIDHIKSIDKMVVRTGSRFDTGYKSVFINPIYDIDEVIEYLNSINEKVERES